MLSAVHIHVVPGGTVNGLDLSEFIKTVVLVNQTNRKIEDKTFEKIIGMLRLSLVINIFYLHFYSTRNLIT